MTSILLASSRSETLPSKPYLKCRMWKAPKTWRLFCLVASVLALWYGQGTAQTPLSNTPTTAAQLAHLFAEQKPVLYNCQTGIYDDLGNQDGDWGVSATPGRIASAAWDIGNNRYLYAYQLTNPNYIDDNIRATIPTTGHCARSPWEPRSGLAQAARRWR